ncbi:hypothetical protein SAMN04488498_101165 [Mesorhizobium albiziae]|uniref:Tat pathway signal sequence domain protein n=1 Tax=Neomesorhizobium albiziae TaxID=335020 RepID=A0A1I3V344_9HYPH|nr:hypothetical protein [Mesorhizobium albiziae]GLS28625.1 hypothetical protein GCM10007937_03320 [Mesorhizobium albiziae]SFJ89532.1 hypothetical protein SAMN04488498_101165 [Mesorhizobium albiziae]
MLKPVAFLRVLTATVAMSPAPVLAQATAPAPVLNLELNALQPSEKGCRFTFVVNNGLGVELAKAAFEIALFDARGVVDRLTVLDFKELPVGKTKVSRFDLAGIDCAKVSRVLINHATECSGAGIEPAACMRQLKASTKTGVTFGL